MTDQEIPSSAEKLRSLQAEYLMLLSEKIKTLEGCARSTHDGMVAPATIDILRDLAHQLAGGGSIYGYPSITETAHELEHFLEAWHGGLLVELNRKLDQLIAACRNAVEKGPAVDSLRKKEGVRDEIERANLPLVAVIDDDPFLRLIYKTLLEEKVRLVLGTNTIEAREIMLEQKPALVLMDDIMPGGQTGLSFLESIREDPVLSAIPIIMVTASDKKEDVLRGLAAGAIDYVIKPFVPDALLRAVKLGLSRKEHKILLALEDTAQADALIERLTPLNCRVIDLKREGKGLKEAMTAEPCIVVFDHIPLPHDAFLELANRYPSSHFVVLGDGGATLNPHIQPPRLLLLPSGTRTEEIVYSIGRTISLMKKAPAPAPKPD